MKLSSTPSSVLPIAALCAALLSPLQDANAEVRALLDTLSEEKVAALTSYLEANPEAEDRDLAVSELIGSYEDLEQKDKLIPLLEERYASLDKGEQMDPQLLLIGTVSPLVELYGQTGNKEGALAFLETVRNDISAHPIARQADGLLKQLEGKLNQPQVGEVMEIVFTATDGSEVDLAAMKGKVVLVDFWATWCGPCVAEMPNDISAFEKHNEAGFEVIGISLDEDKAKLDAFVQEHELPWVQYFDGKGWGNEISGKYGITGIPATFLIGKDGKIAASNLRGPALEAEVTKLLGAE